MSIDTLYADGIEANLQRWAANPGPAPEAGFSMTSFIGAGGRGVPAGALESAGTVSDVLSAFGTAAAAGGDSGGGMFATPTPGERKQEAEARDKMLAGDAWNFQPGNVLRKKAEELAPDPLTAHRADQVIFGLTRFAGKAVADVGTMGPVAGAAVLGLDEANTTTQNLREKGIDTATATKAGAVQGAFSAIGAVMPLGGKTVLQTLGLVGVGGPGSYMAQEALVKNILERASYKDEASLHNPFDPLGLTLATVIPGGFGALHMRTVGKPAPKLEDVVKHIESGGNPNAVGPNVPGQGTAKGEMQVMDATNADPGFGVTPAKDNSPEERARVGRDYLGAMVNRYGDQDKALAAYNAGPGTVDAAMKQHGEAWLANMPKETQKYVEKARKLTGDYIASEAAAKPEVVDAARVAALNETMAKSLPDTPDAYANVMRASDIVAERGGRVAEAEIAPVHDVTAFETELRQVEAEMGTLRPEPVKPVEAPLEGDMPRGRSYDEYSPAEKAAFDERHGIAPGRREEVAATEARIELQQLQSRIAAAEFGQQRLDMVTAPDKADVATVLKDAPAALRYAELKVRAAELREGMAKHAAAQARPSVRDTSNTLPSPDSVALAGDEPAKRGAEVGAQEQPKAAGDAGAAPSPEAGVDHGIAQKIAAERPDLKVVLPGSEEQISVSEALARIAEEQKQDGHWADLVKVAVECALGG